MASMRPKLSHGNCILWSSAQADGSLRVSATLVDSAMLDRWLRGFGADIWDVQKRPVDAQPEADDATCPT